MKKFQPYLSGTDDYLYIAPKESQAYNIFFKIACNMPTLSGSMYEVLIDFDLIKNILVENLSADTALEIYVSSTNVASPIMIKKTLPEYIEQNQIDFKM